MLVRFEMGGEAAAIGEQFHWQLAEVVRILVRLFYKV